MKLFLVVLLIRKFKNGLQQYNSKYTAKYQYCLNKVIGDIN